MLKSEREVEKFRACAVAAVAQQHGISLKDAQAFMDKLMPLSASTATIPAKVSTTSAGTEPGTAKPPNASAGTELGTSKPATSSAATEPGTSKPAISSACTEPDTANGSRAPANTSSKKFANLNAIASKNSGATQKARNDNQE